MNEVEIHGFINVWRKITSLVRFELTTYCLGGSCAIFPESWCALVQTALQAHQSEEQYLLLKAYQCLFIKKPFLPFLMYQIKAIPEDFIVEEIPNRSWLAKGVYLVLKVKKREYNSEDVAILLSKTLHVPRKHVNYAGTKDYHAITTQYYSVKGIQKANLTFDNIEVEAVGFTDEPLSLGALAKNNFTVVVRNLDELPTKKDIIPNTFDDQRFSINNDKVGKAFVKRDFKKACELVIAAGGKNAYTVKEFLEEHPTNPIGALTQLPKKILSLYIHAYQSRLFNTMLSNILKHFSLKELFEKKISLPLIGFGTERPENEICATAYDKILEKEEITQRDFIIRQMPDVASEGVTRDAVIMIGDLQVGELADDERNPNKKKCVISFSLQKGSYATNVIKELF